MQQLQRFLLQAIEIYEIVILARIMLSWIQGPHAQGQFSAFFYALTEPLLAPIRNLLRNISGPLDFSPLILILLLELLKQGIARSSLFF